MNNQLCDDVFSEIPLLINESDLHVSQVRDFLIHITANQCIERYDSEYC